MPYVLKNPAARLTKAQEKDIAQRVVEQAVREAYEEVAASWAYSPDAQKKEFLPKDPTSYYAFKSTKHVNAGQSDNKGENKEEEKENKDDGKFPINNTEDANLEISHEIEKENNDVLNEERSATNYDDHRCLKKILTDAFSASAEEKKEKGQKEEENGDEEIIFSLSRYEGSLRDEFLELNEEINKPIHTDFDDFLSDDGDATTSNNRRSRKQLQTELYEKIDEDDEEKQENEEKKEKEKKSDDESNIESNPEIENAIIDPNFGGPSIDESHSILSDAEIHPEIEKKTIDAYVAKGDSMNREGEINSEIELKVIDYNSDDSYTDEGDSVDSEAESVYFADIETEDVGDIETQLDEEETESMYFADNEIEDEDDIEVQFDKDESESMYFADYDTVDEDDTEMRMENKERGDGQEEEGEDEDEADEKEEDEESKGEGHKALPRSVEIRRSIQIDTDSNITHHEGEALIDIEDADNADYENDIYEYDGIGEVIEEITPHTGKLRLVIHRMKKIICCGLAIKSCFRCFEAAKSDDNVSSDSGEQENDNDSTGTLDFIQ